MDEIIKLIIVETNDKYYRVYSTDGETEKPYSPREFLNKKDARKWCIAKGFTIGLSEGGLEAINLYIKKEDNFKKRENIKYHSRKAEAVKTGDK